MKLTLPPKFNRAIDWFDQRPTRERVLLVAALVSAMYFFVNLGIIRASDVRAKELNRKLALQATEISAVRKNVAALSSLAAQNPIKQELNQFEKMKQTIAEADQLMAQLDSAPKVGDVVKALLKSSPGLELVSLKTLPVTMALDGQLPSVPAAAAPKPTAGTPPSQAAAAAKAAAPARAPRPIYRHGVEIAVKGNYLALVRYLETLQTQSGRLQWGDMSLEVQAHPSAVLRVTVYTLSGSANANLG